MRAFVQWRSRLAWLRKNSIQRRFCISARVYSCRRLHQLNLGFSPCASIACRLRCFRWLPATLLLSLAIALSACHSYHIDVTIKNNTGGPISLLELDYPSASFGSDALASGADFHHVVQTRGSGPVKIQYAAANGHQVQVTGPKLYEKQEGTLQVVLLPDGKAEFSSSLNPAR